VAAGEIAYGPAQKGMTIEPPERIVELLEEIYL